VKAVMLSRLGVLNLFWTHDFIYPIYNGYHEKHPFTIAGFGLHVTEITTQIGFNNNKIHNFTKGEFKERWALEYWLGQGPC
jgi:hypothetical protein